MRVIPVVASMFGLMALLISASPGSSATNLLVDGGFEQWAGGALVEWGSAGAVAMESAEVRSGAAAVRFEGDGTVQQSVAVSPAMKYLVAAWARSLQGTGLLTLRMRWLGAGFIPIGAPVEVQRTPGATFSEITLEAIAPAGAAFLTVTFEAEGAGAFALVLDDASVEEEAVTPPTATPTDPATATPTPTIEGAGPTATPTEPPGSTGTATRTPRPPTATRTPTRAPTAPHELPRSPRLANEDEFEPPEPDDDDAPPGFARPPATDDQLLANPSFELEYEGRPVFWSKFGGEWGVVGGGPDGQRSAWLASLTDSVKWVYQRVPVEPGAWYEGSAWVRRTSGEGTIQLRLNWHASSNGTGASAWETLEGETHAGFAWTRIHIGPIQAPPGARSARFRIAWLNESSGSAEFDGAVFRRVEAPATPPTPRPTSSIPDPTASALSGAASALERSAATPGAVSTVLSASSPAGVLPPTPRPPRTGSGQASTPAGPLRLSEVLPNPEGGGREAGEWVEIHNPTTAAVSLAGWQIGDSRALDALPDVVIPPGGYALVGGSPGSAPPGVLLARVADGAIGGALNNDGDAVRLIRPDGAVADALSYGSDTSVFDPSAPLPAEGESIARREGLEGSAAWQVSLEPTAGGPNALPTAEAAPRGRVGLTSGAGPVIAWVILGVCAALSLAAGLMHHAESRRLPSHAR